MRPHWQGAPWRTGHQSSYVEWGSSASARQTWQSASSWNAGATPSSSSTAAPAGASIAPERRTPRPAGVFPRPATVGTRPSLLKPRVVPVWQQPPEEKLHEEVLTPPLAEPLAEPEPSQESAPKIQPSRSTRKFADSGAGRVLELRNFPASWKQDGFAVKLDKLVKKYGPLVKEPVITPIGDDFVVRVTYENETHALEAVKKLHGVDNRTKEEKNRDQTEPLDHQRLSVKVVPLEHLDGLESGHMHREGESLLDDSTSCSHEQKRPSSSIPTKEQPPSAPTSSQAEEAELRRLKRSELVQRAEDAGATRAEVAEALDEDDLIGALVSLIICKRHQAEEVGIHEKPEVESAGAYCHEKPELESTGDEEPWKLYVDELMQTTEEPGDDDCEVFIQNLPIEDYDEEELIGWLNTFGVCKDIVFLRGDGGDLSGECYVRFESHTEVMDLFDSLADDAEAREDESQQIKPSWSLSERMKQPREGQLKPDAIDCVLAQLHSLESTRRPANSAQRVSFVQDNGPLHFTYFSDHGFDTQDDLRAYLEKVIWAAFRDDTTDCHPDTSAGATPCSTVAVSPSLARAPSQAPPRELEQSFQGKRPPLAATCPAQQRAQPSQVPEPLSQVQDGLGAVSHGSTPTHATTAEAQPKPPGGLESSGKKQPFACSAEPSGGPACVVVRGFTPKWQADEIKRVFAIYGGVVALKFIEDSLGRSAIVELKNAERAETAIAKMNNIQVGDGEMIDECTLIMKPMGASTQPASLKAIFLDELPNVGRPPTAANGRDSEVFLLNLPTDECSEAEIGDWMRGFGPYKKMSLLRDATGAFNKKGYVRFVEHQNATDCIKACGEEFDDEANIVAQWSESERAEQRSDSVYGFDLHDAFTQTRLEEIAGEAKVQHLWMYSPALKPPSEWPAAQGDQFHFLVACADEQVGPLRARLEDALQALYRDKCQRSAPEPTPPPKASAAPSPPKASAAPSPPKASAAPSPPKANVEPPPPLSSVPPTPHPRYGRLMKPEDKAKIDEGEAFIADAVKLAAEAGKLEEAIKKYHQGIQCMVSIGKPLDETVRRRASICMGEAEQLKERLSSSRQALQQQQAKEAKEQAYQADVAKSKDILKQGDDAEAKMDFAKACDFWKKGLAAWEKALKASEKKRTHEDRKLLEKYLEKIERVNASHKKAAEVVASKKGAAEKPKKQMDGKRSRSRSRDAKPKKQTIQTPCSFSTDVRRKEDARQEAAKAVLRRMEEANGGQEVIPKDAGTKPMASSVEVIPKDAGTRAKASSASIRPEDVQNNSQSKSREKDRGKKEKDKKERKRDEQSGSAQKRARHDSPKAPRATAVKSGAQDPKLPGVGSKAPSKPLVPASLPKASFAGAQPNPAPSGPPALQAAQAPPTAKGLQAPPAAKGAQTQSGARRDLLVGKAKAKAKS